MADQNLWTEEELTIALNLYWKVPYNKISGSSNLKIKELARLIGRTPASVAYKLMNFTSLDPERQSKGNKGKARASELDKEVWNRYFGEWEKLLIESARITASRQNRDIEEILQVGQEMIDKKGTERERVIRARVNQQDFRQWVLAAYNEKCCITHISIPQLLNASHIIPWSKNEQERLNPKNGLCLNAIHDRAFDKGLITITPDYEVKVSKVILAKRDEWTQTFFTRFNNTRIALPDRFLPEKTFLLWHSENVFIN